MIVAVAGNIGIVVVCLSCRFEFDFRGSGFLFCSVVVEVPVGDGSGLGKLYLRESCGEALCCVFGEKGWTEAVEAVEAVFDVVEVWVESVVFLRANRCPRSCNLVSVEPCIKPNLARTCCCCCVEVLVPAGAEVGLARRDGCWEAGVGDLSWTAAGRVCCIGWAICLQRIGKCGGLTSSRCCNRGGVCGCGGCIGGGRTIPSLRAFDGVDAWEGVVDCEAWLGMSRQ